MIAANPTAIYLVILQYIPNACFTAAHFEMSRSTIRFLHCVARALREGLFHGCRDRRRAEKWPSFGPSHLGSIICQNKTGVGMIGD